MIFSRSTWKHLRIPFSIFLMPFFCFALAEVPNINWVNAIMAFVAIHIFYNPASNGFNSYYDKDEKSIGGLEHPPTVEPDLLYASLIFDFIALILAVLCNVYFAIMLFIIGMVSKAYSHPAIRLKKYPVIGLLTVAFFQGSWTYLMSYMACGDFGQDALVQPRVWQAAGICSLLLLASYPMTQVYQHEEDSKRGDQTFSLLLGIRGTFLWTAGIFGLGFMALSWYFLTYYSISVLIALALFTSPTLLFFGKWTLAIWKDPNQADFKRTMTLNILSSVGFILFFLYLYWQAHSK